MANLNSSPSNEKPNLDVLFPELKKTDTALPAPRFMAPATAAATLMKGVPPSARAVPPPPSLRGSKPASFRPPPPSARAPRGAIVEEVHDDELLAAEPAQLEPIRPVDDDDDDGVDDGPTVALASPLAFAPLASRPVASAPRVLVPTPPPSRRSGTSPSAAKLPPLPSAPSFAKPPSTPSAAKLPPLPTPPPSSLLELTPPSLLRGSVAPMPPVYTEDEVESRAAPAVRTKATRASAAASLVASSNSMKGYAPPSVAPPAPRPIGTQETTSASRAHSLMPTAASVPPPALVAVQKKSRAGLVTALAFASLGLIGGLGFAAVKGAPALGIGSPAAGAVAITAAGPGGSKIEGLRILIDGVVKCESAPCKLNELTAGTHFVSAEAPGFATTAARAISVERGGEAALHIDLSPTAPALAPAFQAEVKATNLADLKPEEVAERAAQAPVATKVAKAEQKEAKKAEPQEAKKAIADDASGQGTLNINSIPMANVVLDGRPVGSTPLVGLKVSAGPHSVMFIHPEHGRKASGTTVKAGGSATVAVRF
jgi:hypothetical protein